MNLFKFYRLDFSIRNLGISLIGIFSIINLGFLPQAQKIILVILQLLLVQMNSFSMNHFFDYKVWKEENYIGKLVDNGWSENKILFLTIIPLIVLIFTIPLSNIYILILPAYIFLFYIYQSPRFRLKDNYLWSIILNALCLGLILYIYPYLFIVKKITLTFLVFSVVFFFYMSFHEVVHQIAHWGKDKIYSLSEAKGIKTAVRVAKIFLIIPVIFAVLALIINPLKYLFFTGILIFSGYRLYILHKIKNKKENFQNIRERWDKFYSVQEAIYIIIVLTIMYFI